MGTAMLMVLIGLGVLAAGILIGRYYVPDDRRLKRTARHGRAYLRSLNLLLSRDLDGTIEQLREVVEEDVSDIEPYFALGALFRRRGEWERAIRTHQAIEMRADADKHLRLRALYELGLDFRAASMPRRAVEAMEACLERDAKHEGAHKALCGLYEQTGRFVDAAAAWEHLDKLRGSAPSPRIPHLYAAAASAAVRGDDLDGARELLKKADRLAPDDPHILAVAAELAAERGDIAGAGEHVRKALLRGPELAPALVERLLDLHRRAAEGDAGARDGDDLDEDWRARTEELARGRTVAVLDGLIQTGATHPGIRMSRARLRATYDIEGALSDVRRVVEAAPDMASARLLRARLVLSLGKGAEIRRELASLLEPGSPLGQVAAGVWVCRGCGHVADEFFWRCDHCRRWSSASYDWHRRDRPRRSRDRRARPRDGGSRLSRAGAWISGAWSGMRSQASAGADEARE